MYMYASRILSIVGEGERASYSSQILTWNDALALALPHHMTSKLVPSLGPKLASPCPI